jgi:hypothetical protein
VYEPQKFYLGCKIAEIIDISITEPQVQKNALTLATKKEIPSGSSAVASIAIVSGGTGLSVVAALAGALNSLSPLACSTLCAGFRIPSETGDSEDDDPGYDLCGRGDSDQDGSMEVDFH